MIEDFHKEREKNEKIKNEISRLKRENQGYKKENELLLKENARIQKKILRKKRKADQMTRKNKEIETKIQDQITNEVKPDVDRQINQFHQQHPLIIPVHMSHPFQATPILQHNTTLSQPQNVQYPTYFIGFGYLYNNHQN